MDRIIFTHLPDSLYSIFKDYMKCAKSILKAKENMSKNHNTTFVLISSISAHTDLQWGGAARNAKGKNATEALTFLHDAGVKKFDSVIDKGNISDMIQFVIWDLIAAMGATQFATCSGCNETTECHACNHQSKFPKLAMELRGEQKNIKCWPT
jgi:hypothetical protein